MVTYPFIDSNWVSKMPLFGSSLSVRNVVTPVNRLSLFLGNIKYHLFEHFPPIISWQGPWPGPTAKIMLIRMSNYPDPSPSLECCDTCKQVVSFLGKYQILADQAPALPGKNLKSLHHRSRHFTIQNKVFSPVTRLGFEVWGPGVELVGSRLC